MMHHWSPSNIKFRLVCKETFSESLLFIERHFFPYEPLAEALPTFLIRVDPDLDIKGIRKESMRKTFENSPLTLIAQDSKQNDKIVGISIASIESKYTKEWIIDEFYNMKLSDEEYIEKVSKEHEHQTGNWGTLIMWWVISNRLLK